MATKDDAETPIKGQYAFRCNTCGHLEEPGNAGENDVPAACTVCGKGVTYSVDGAGIPVKKLDPDNWTVLADLDGDGLAGILEHHAIGADEIVRHEPTPREDPDRDPQFLERSASDEVATSDELAQG